MWDWNHVNATVARSPDYDICDTNRPFQKLFALNAYRIPITPIKSNDIGQPISSAGTLQLRLRALSIRDPLGCHPTTIHQEVPDPSVRP